MSSIIGSGIGIGLINFFQTLNADMVEHAREWILVATTTCTKQPHSAPINYSLHIVHNFAFEHNGAVLHMRNIRFVDSALATKFAQIQAMSSVCDKSIVRCQILVRADDIHSLAALTSDLRNITHAFTIVSWSVLLHKENFSAAMASGSPFAGLAQFTSSVVQLHRYEQTRVGHATKYYSREIVDCDDLCSPDPPVWKLGLRLHQTQSLMWMQQLEDRVASGRNFISVPRWLPLVGTEYVVLLESCLIIHKDAFERIGLTHRSSVLQKIKYRGGILADETGSGKTSVVLALIVATRGKLDIGKGGVNTHKEISAQETLATIPVQATLVIVPMNLCAQWVAELAKFVDAGVNHVCVYNKRQYASMTIQKIMAADIVFTTAEFLSGKAYPTAYKQSDFYVMNRLVSKASREGGCDATDPVIFRGFFWKRIIFDEQHAFPVVSGVGLRSIKGIKAQVYWGITATPSSNTMNNMLKVANDELPNVDASMLLNQCIRRSAFAHELEPFVVQTHWVDIQPRERDILNTYRHEGLPRLIQLCTCFNVLALFGSDGNMSVRADEIQVCMTFDELSRMMVTRRVSEIKSHMPEVETLQRTITVDKKLLEHIQGTDGVEEHKDQDQDAAMEQSVEQEPDLDLDLELDLEQEPAAEENTDDSSIVRVIKRRIKVNERKFAQLKDRMHSLVKQCTFFQDQIEMAADQRICPICFVNTTDVITQCGHWFCKECTLTYTHQKSVTPCPLCKVPLRQRDWIQKVDEPEARAVVVPEAKPVSDAEKYGSKLAAIVELLRRIKESGERAIMFVQWTDLLRTLRAILSTGGLKVVAIMGNTGTRNAAVQKLKTGEVDVLLLSMDISTTGLNLTDANHVIFAHALVGGSPSTQTHSIKQAVARVYRIGQMRRVFIHWFITKNTDEERVFLASAHQ
jgi:superfamily II DNA or RNA helicase